MTFSMRTHIFIFTLALLGLSGVAQAQEASSQKYMRLSFGLSFADGLVLNGASNDGGSLCDEYINPAYAKIAACATQPAALSEGWESDFSSSDGDFAALAIGTYLRDNIRVEAEYFTHATNLGQTVTPRHLSAINQQKQRDELHKVDSYLGTIQSRNLFANIFYEFDAVGQSGKFIPNLGFGLGFGEREVDWGSNWTRSANPDDIDTGRDHPDLTPAEEEAVRNNLAGTSSVANRTFKDDSIAWQVLAGVDYVLNATSMLGLQLRWVEYDDDFTGNGAVWNPLRGHPPYNRRDGTRKVTGGISSDDMNFYAIAISLSHKF